MSNGDPETPLVFQHVLFEQPMPYGLAKEQTVLAISASHAFAHDLSLRPASRVQPRSGAISRHAALDAHVVRLLKTDAVAVILADHTILDDRGVTLIKKHGCANWIREPSE